jgi:hypothetical protein
MLTGASAPLIRKSAALPLRHDGLSFLATQTASLLPPLYTPSNSRGLLRLSTHGHEDEHFFRTDLKGRSRWGCSCRRHESPCFWVTASKQFQVPLVGALGSYRWRSERQLHRFCLSYHCSSGCEPFDFLDPAAPVGFYPSYSRDS